MIKKLFLINLLAFLLFIASSLTALAAEECEPITVDVILRGYDSQFIPNINFEIYVQENDVDGRPKPSSLLKAGKIDPNLGRGRVSFVNDSGSFALRVYDLSKAVGSFWFYDDINVSCGESIVVEEYLSSLDIELRDTDGELIKNKEVLIYTQRYDADNEPIKEKQDLVGKLNTSEEGEARTYVPGSENSIDGNGTDYYVMEFNGKDGGKYTEYDIRVQAARSNSVDYVVSDLRLNIKDENGIAFPSGEKVYIYNQIENEEGEKSLGDQIKILSTNDKGQVTLEYPAGKYAARIVGANKQNLDFYDLEIPEEDRGEYDLSSSGTWQTSGGACAEAVLVELKTTSIGGEVLADMNFELYTQIIDANGQDTAGSLVFAGKTDISGKASKSFAPDPRKKYALKIYSYNKGVGEYWYMDEFRFQCGADMMIEKSLPAINLVLRKADNSLVKNKKFSLYTQKTDADNNPIKEKQDLVSSSFSSSEEGLARIFVGPAHPTNEKKNGLYVLEVLGENNKIYTKYDIKVESDIDTELQFIFSELLLQVFQGNGQVAANTPVSAYKQTSNASGAYSLGGLEMSGVTDANGFIRFPLPSGFYAITMKDIFKKDIVFYRQRVAEGKKTSRSVKLNMTRVSAYDAGGRLLPNTSFKIYSLKEDEKGRFMRLGQIGGLKTPANGYLDFSIVEGPYLLTVASGKSEYGEVYYAEKGKLQEMKLVMNANNIVRPTDIYTLAKPPKEITLADKLSGKILLQVESKGEAWYVDTLTKKRYYMRDGATAYEMMRKFGLGISNNDLSKIPVGLDKRFSMDDYDGDYISDKMEEAIKTNAENHDSDQDGYNDYEELANNFNPLGPGALKIDNTFADKMKGRILLQVESRGEAWYVNPSNGRRYYLADGASAYEIMRFLSLGISNDNLEEIEEGKM
jgi:hypothetical protein